MKLLMLIILSKGFLRGLVRMEDQQLAGDIFVGVLITIVLVAIIIKAFMSARKEESYEGC